MLGWLFSALLLWGLTVYFTQNHHLDQRHLILWIFLIHAISLALYRFVLPLIMPDTVAALVTLVLFTLGVMLYLRRSAGVTTWGKRITILGMYYLIMTGVVLLADKILGRT